MKKRRIVSKEFLQEFANEYYILKFKAFTPTQIREELQKKFEVKSSSYYRYLEKSKCLGLISVKRSSKIIDEQPKQIELTGSFVKDIKEKSKEPFISSHSNLPQCNHIKLSNKPEIINKPIKKTFWGFIKSLFLKYKI